MRFDQIEMHVHPSRIALAINIRPMNLEDIDEILEIDRLSFPTPWPESAYRYELTSNPVSRLWVAELSEGFRKNRLVGMIVIWLIEDEAHIATIAVHPGFRREKIGSRLLGFALQELIQEGAREAMLEVRNSNQAAQALYRQFGFEVVNRRPRYYRDNNEDALLMSSFDLDLTTLELFSRVSRYELSE